MPCAEHTSIALWWLHLCCPPSACRAPGAAQPPPSRGCSACLPASPLCWHRSNLWQAVSGSWKWAKHWHNGKKVVFCWFNFLIWLSEGSENQQGGVGWALECSRGDWGQCVQLGNHTRDWHWPGSSCTSGESQHFVFLNWTWASLSTGYIYKITVASYLYRVLPASKARWLWKLSLAQNFQSAERNVDFTGNWFSWNSIPCWNLKQVAF